MKIDLKEIINIKNKKDLNKFPLDKPIHLNNYLFHYLILFDKLDILKLFNIPIFKENEENLNGFFLASKYSKFNILKYFIIHYKDYIYNKNDNNEMFINYLDINNIIKLLSLSKYLDLKLLLNNEISDNYIIYDNLLLNCNYKQIKKLLLYYKPDNYNLNYLITNNNLNTEQLINILNLFDNLNKKNINDFGIIFPAILKNDIKLINYLIKRNVDIDYYTTINTYHPLRYSLHNNLFDIYKILWKHIKNTYNFTSTDKNLNNIAHYILNKDIYLNNPTSIEILENCSSVVWNQNNINKITPIDMIINLNYEKYNYLLKNIKINKNKKKLLLNKKINDNWIKLIKNMEECHYDNNIDFKEYSYAHSNLFQAGTKDCIIFSLYIKLKYKNVYLPTVINNNDNKNLILNYNYLITFPWVISFTDKDNYNINKNLNYLININKKKYDFAFCFLSLKYKTGLHANILIYDFNNNTLERFDPYGSVYEENLDDILEEELTWNTGLTYLRPKDYLPTAGFQTISDETNIKNMKQGDLDGYCLAWCFWYLEQRFNNKNIKNNILIDKLIKKIKSSKNSFIEYIRNYANKLNKYKINYLVKSGLNDKEISNINNEVNYDIKFNNIVLNVMNKF